MGQSSGRTAAAAGAGLLCKEPLKNRDAAVPSSLGGVNRPCETLGDVCTHEFDISGHLHHASPDV